MILFIAVFSSWQNITILDNPTHWRTQGGGGGIPPPLCPLREVKNKRKTEAKMGKSSEKNQEGK